MGLLLSVIVFVFLILAVVVGASYWIDRGA